MLGAGHESPPEAEREVTDREDCEGLAGPVSIPETRNLKNLIFLLEIYQALLW